MSYIIVGGVVIAVETQDNTAELLRIFWCNAPPGNGTGFAVEIAPAFSGCRSFHV
ncbi:MAG: hypothetical protein P4N59_11905 [Negativicutes bacterium]|nr:hypothetical protein [Negativicutes bacterium]